MIEEIKALIPRAPYIKKKGYVPNPVVKFGIPKEADSRFYPNVIGTAAWENYWNEQLYYIHNGYQTGGLWLPGRYYYYMNFAQMNTIDRGVITPDATDLHLELALHIEYCKTHGYNLMIPKGRRKGISEATHPMVTDYGYRFSIKSPGVIGKYQGAVVAGDSKPIDDYIDKWKFLDASIVPEFYTGRLTKNDSEIIAGWGEKNQLNSWTDKGTFNTLYTRTMHSDYEGLKGLYCDDIVVEEVGKFEHFLKFWGASKDCIMSNQKQVGSMFVYGTGGDIDKGSRDFKKAWSRSQQDNFCEVNRFIRFVVDAKRFYFYGGSSNKHQQLPLDSPLYKTYKPFELIGVEDIESAEKDIKKRREDFMKAGNIKDYNEFVQNNPLNEAEIFKKTVVNDFNSLKLAEQSDRIFSQPKKYSRYKLEFVLDDKGMIKMPYEVKIAPAQPHEDENECVWIIDTELYRKGYRNLYVSGIDSYDQDRSKTSKSLGGMCVLIRDNSIEGALKKVPVAVIRCRPKRKEKFYELCFKLAIYFNLDGNVLGDVRNPGIIQYFKDRGGEKYLAVRPKKFEKADSSQQHDYWLSINTYSKPLMVSLMQSNIEDHIQDHWFDHEDENGPRLIGEIQNYDEVEIGSDNDLADAFGIALIQDVSCEFRPVDNSATESEADRFRLSFEKNIYTSSSATFRNGEMDMG